MNAQCCSVDYDANVVCLCRLVATALQGEASSLSTLDATDSKTLVLLRPRMAADGKPERHQKEDAPNA